MTRLFFSRWAGFIVLLGLTLTATLTRHLSNLETERAKRDMQAVAQGVMSSIRKKLGSLEIHLRSVDALFSSSVRVDYDEFVKFTSFIRESDPEDILHISFIKKVETGAEALLAEARQDGIPEFTLRGTLPAGTHYVHYFLLPSPGTPQVAGEVVGVDSPIHSILRQNDRGLGCVVLPQLPGQDNDSLIPVAFPIHRESGQGFATLTLHFQHHLQRVLASDPSRTALFLQVSDSSGRELFSSPRGDVSLETLRFESFGTTFIFQPSISMESLQERMGYSPHIAGALGLLLTGLVPMFLHSYRHRATRAIKDLVRLSPEPSLLVDSRGIVLACNAALGNFLGQYEGELVGRTVTNLVPDEVKPSHPQRIEAYFSHPRQVTLSGPRIKVLHSSHIAIPVDISLVPVDIDGRTYVIAGLRDQRARLEQEQRLRDQEDRLAQSQKLESIGKLAGGISHEYNNMLLIISGYAELLIQNSQLDEGSRAKAGRILQAAKRSASITQGLLAFSRNQSMDLAIVDIDREIDQSIEILRRLAGENMTLTFEKTPGEKLARIDSTQFGQVLMNLTLNSRDAMPSGGELRVSTALAWGQDVSASTAPHGIPSTSSYVAIMFSDNGCGIRKEDHPRVFEPFFTTKRAGKGTGLGLSIVHGIITQFGGHITFTSEVGKGTTFNIYLPQQR